MTPCLACGSEGCCMDRLTAADGGWICRAVAEDGRLFDVVGPLYREGRRWALSPSWPDAKEPERGVEPGDMLVIRQHGIREHNLGKVVAEASGWRIEHLDGVRTGSGMFASFEAALAYARERRWALHDAIDRVS